MCKHSVRNSSCLVIFAVWVDKINLWKKETGVVTPCYPFLLSLSFQSSSIDHLIPCSANCCHYPVFVLTLFLSFTHDWLDWPPCALSLWQVWWWQWKCNHLERGSMNTHTKRFTVNQCMFGLIDEVAGIFQTHWTGSLEIQSHIKGDLLIKIPGQLQSTFFFF